MGAPVRRWLATTPAAAAGRPGCWWGRARGGPPLRPESRRRPSTREAREWGSEDPRRPWTPVRAAAARRSACAGSASRRVRPCRSRQLPAHPAGGRHPVLAAAVRGPGPWWRAPRCTRRRWQPTAGRCRRRSAPPCRRSWWGRPHGRSRWRTHRARRGGRRCGRPPGRHRRCGRCAPRAGLDGTRRPGPWPRPDPWLGLAALTPPPTPGIPRAPIGRRPPGPAFPRARGRSTARPTPPRGRWCRSRWRAGRRGSPRPVRGTGRGCGCRREGGC